MKRLNGLIVAALAVIAMFLLAGVGYVIAPGALAALGYVTVASKVFNLAEGKNKIAGVLHLVVAAGIFGGVTWWVFTHTGVYQRLAN